MPDINSLIATVGDYGIGNAFSKGQEEGRYKNALAFAAKNYATNPQAAANALLEIGDVRGATSIMENVRQAEQDRLNRQRQGSLDELNRRDVESQISARNATAGAKDLRAVGDQVVDFSDPSNPRVVFSKPDPFVESLGGGGQPAGTPAPAMPASVPSMTAAGAAPLAPIGSQFGPRALAATDFATGKGNLQAGVTGGLPQVGARPPSPIPAAAPAAATTGTLADLTSQQRRTAIDMIRRGDRTGAQKYVNDILTGGSEEKPPSGYRWNAEHTALEPIPGGPATAIAPELSARVALGESFQADLPSIKGVLQQSFGSGGDPVAVNARSNMALGIGPEGDAYRKTQSGTDALVRMLTGAGLSSQESADYAFRYLPNPYRDPFDTMTSKVDRLGRELNTITSIVTRGKGGADLVKELRDHIRQSQPESGGTTQQAQGAAPPPPKVGDVVRGWRFNGGDPAVESNWAQVQQ